MNIGNRPLFKVGLSVFGPHIGGLIVTLILSFALPNLLLGAGLFLTVPLFLITYSFAVYATSWRIGHEDMNSANFGHSTLNRKRGLLIGLIANSLNILSSIVLLVNYLLYSCGAVHFSFIIPYKMINPEIWPLMNAIGSSAYLSDLSLWQILIFVLLPFIPVLICELSYVLGTYDFSILQKVVYKNKKQVSEADSNLPYQAKKTAGNGSHVWEPASSSSGNKEKKPSVLQKILYEKDDQQK